MNGAEGTDAMTSSFSSAEQSLDPSSSTSSSSPDAKILPNSDIDFDSDTAFPALGAWSTIQGKGKKAVGGQNTRVGMWSSGPSGAHRLATSQQQRQTQQQPSVAASTASTRPGTPGSQGGNSVLNMARSVPSATPSNFSETLTLPTSSIAPTAPAPRKGAGRGSGAALQSAPSLGEVLGHIMRLTPSVRIEASTSRQAGTTTFLFRGTNESDVHRATKELLARIAKKANTRLFCVAASTFLICHLSTDHGYYRCPRFDQLFHHRYWRLVRLSLNAVAPILA